MNEARPARPDRLLRIVAIFLVVGYGVGSPLTAILEFKDHTFSTRFDVPAALIYVTCAVQVVCVFGILRRPTATWAAVVLTVTTIGAIGVHLRIGSPQTAIAAVVFTVVQIWFAWKVRADS